MALALTALGCSQERTVAPPDACLTWQSFVAPLLSTCTQCHGGATPAASYDLTSYLGALGGGADDLANAVAGDASSRLLTRLAPSAADAPHQVAAETLAAVRRWIVDCELAALDTPVHERGVLDPASGQFHGVTLANLGWDLRACMSCHGDDFSGGTSGSSCTSCHQDGPTACETCHPLDPAGAPRGAQGGQRPYGAGALSNAHRGHARAGLGCDDCHTVPQRWDDLGHVRRDDQRGAAGADPSPAELTFGPRARAAGAAPQYAEGKCSGVYCHGATLATGGGRLTQPAWTGADQAACGTCHGAPPASHADDRCVACHSTATATLAPHVDGVLTVGATAGCSGCHGDATSAAPPRDLSGATSTTARGVGAHRAHLEAQHRLRGPVACADCHRVPGALREAGHIDTAGAAEVTASLGWDGAALTCGTAWCHGPGRPRWTGTGDVFCGSCHGVPPADANHTAGLPLTACVTCHPRTVDAFGNILLGPGGLTSEHIDGNVDLP